MPQCLTCRYYVPHRPHKGAGECWQSRIGKGLAGRGAPVLAVGDALQRLECANWRLLEQGQMKSRSVRRWVWDRNNCVELK